MSPTGNIFRVTGPFCGNSPVTGEFPTQWPVPRSFGVFFDQCLNIRLSKQSSGWWFETPSRSLWRHHNVLKYMEGILRRNWHTAILTRQSIGARGKFPQRHSDVWCYATIKIFNSFLHSKYTRKQLFHRVYPKQYNTLIPWDRVTHAYIRKRGCHWCK